MKTVAIVAPSFAPSSYPPAIRVRFFASHLPKFGWKPVVVTVRPEFLEEPQDPAFLSLLPPELEVVRTAAVPQRLTRLLHFGDLGLRAYLYLLRELRRLCRRGLDAILIPGPPWYPFCLGPVLRREFGVPFVLDYIDPWLNSVGAEARFPSKAWAANRLAARLERAPATQAAAIVAVSTGTNETVRQTYPEIPADRFTAIPYGFEPADFAHLRESGEQSQHLLPYTDAVNLCYVGAMLPKAYGTVRALFRAVRKLRVSNAAAERIRVHFFGTTYAAGDAAQALVLPVAREEGVEEIVTEHPARVPYLDALRILASTDLVLALGSSEPHYTASKIFPCLLARRPLLAIYHQASSVCDILRQARSGRLVTFDEACPVEQHVDEIAAALQDFVSGSGFPINPAGIDNVAQEFSAESMTRILANVLDRAAGTALGSLKEPVVSRA